MKFLIDYLSNYSNICIFNLQYIKIKNYIIYYFLSDDTVGYFFQKLSFPTLIEV